MNKTMGIKNSILSEDIFSFMAKLLYPHLRDSMVKIYNYLPVFGKNTARGRHAVNFRYRLLISARLPF